MEYRKGLLFVLGLCVLSFGVVSSAEAAPKRYGPQGHFPFWGKGWDQSHWKDQDFMPYMRDSLHPHRVTWADRDWQPEDWAVQRGTAGAVVEEFYEADILRDRMMKGDRPVLLVGPQFYHLGFYDQQRVAQMVDAAYGVSAENGVGYFELYDWKSKKPIGLYDAGGLQLQ